MRTTETTNTTNKKICPECGSVINGRSDKVFCSDYCRNAYNNRQNSDTSAFTRRIVNTLRKNRRILSSLNPAGRAKVHKNILMNQGFNFDYFTNVYKTKAGNTFYFCFEQGYLSLGNNVFALVAKHEDL